MPQKFTNRAVSTLQAGINNVVTSLAVAGPDADLYAVADTGTSPVNTGSLNWFKAMIIDTSGNFEIVHVRTRTGGSATFSNVIRGQDGTTARSFSAGASVICYITAADAETALSHPGTASAAHAASAISNTPAGNIAAITVQTAINELDSEKLAASAVSAFGLTLIDDVDAAAARATLGVAPQATRIDVASAATLDLTANAPNSNDIRITGTTAISAVTIGAGRVMRVTFSGALTLTNNASIVTQTGANIVTAAGDTCILRATAANTVEVMAYSPAGLVVGTANPLSTGTASSGTSLAYARQDHVHPEPDSIVRLHTSNGYGSTNTCIRRFLTAVQNTGADITYADSATLGASFTINKTGMYAINYFDSFSALSDIIGVSLNSSQLSTALQSITIADRVAMGQGYAATAISLCSWVGRLNAGDVIRAHTSGGGTGFAAYSNFTIAKV